MQNKISKKFNYDFFNIKSSVETGEIEGIKFIFVDDVPVFMDKQGTILFTMHGLYKYRPKEKFVVVDMGAVKFVTSGADVMAPGIVDADVSIDEDDQVWICDEKHHKPLAVGIALMNGMQMKNEKQGKAVRVIHYIGDRLWTLTAKSL
jgi:PUA domain protein